jgi:hypothetical protein
MTIAEPKIFLLDSDRASVFAFMIGACSLFAISRTNQENAKRVVKMISDSNRVGYIVVAVLALSVFVGSALAGTQMPRIVRTLTVVVSYRWILDIRSLKRPGIPIGFPYEGNCVIPDRRW